MYVRPTQKPKFAFQVLVLPSFVRSEQSLCDAEYLSAGNSTTGSAVGIHDLTLLPCRNSLESGQIGVWYYFVPEALGTYRISVCPTNSNAGDAFFWVFPANSSSENCTLGNSTLCFSATPTMCSGNKSGAFMEFYFVNSDSELGSPKYIFVSARNSTAGEFEIDFTFVPWAPNSDICSGMEFLPDGNLWNRTTVGSFPQENSCAVGRGTWHFFVPNFPGKYLFSRKYCPQQEHVFVLESVLILGNFSAKKNCTKALSGKKIKCEPMDLSSEISFCQKDPRSAEIDVFPESVGIPHNIFVPAIFHHKDFVEVLSPFTLNATLWIPPAKNTFICSASKIDIGENIFVNSSFFGALSESLWNPTIGRNFEYPVLWFYFVPEIPGIYTVNPCKSYNDTQFQIIVYPEFPGKFPNCSVHLNDNKSWFMEIPKNVCNKSQKGVSIEIFPQNVGLTHFLAVQDHSGIPGKFYSKNSAEISVNVNLKSVTTPSPTPSSTGAQTTYASTTTTPSTTSSSTSASTLGTSSDPTSGSASTSSTTSFPQPSSAPTTSSSNSVKDIVIGILIGIIVIFVVAIIVYFIFSKKICERFQRENSSQNMAYEPLGAENSEPK